MAGLLFLEIAENSEVTGIAVSHASLQVSDMDLAPKIQVSGKHIVIFGCGYVGSHFAGLALERGARVTALTRNPAVAERLGRVGVRTIIADLAEHTWHDSLPEGADFVLDCVGSGGTGLDGYRRSYVQGMSSILSWARGCGAVGTISFTSSTSVYPQGDGARVDEDSPSVGASERGQILLEAENALRESKGACRRWFVLRLTGIYGPARHSLLDQVRLGEVSGRGEQRLNLAHRDDVCAAIWATFEAPGTIANETLNVTGDFASKKIEIAGWLANRLGVPPPRFTGASGGGRAAITPDRTVANDKIRRVLGWRPQFPTFREGYENILSR